MNDEMKKWAPYKSLVEHEDFIKNMIDESNKIEKPILSEEDEEDINNILVNYNNEKLKIVYYEDGYIKTVYSHLYKIDKEGQRIYLSRCRYISFIDLIHLYYN